MTASRAQFGLCLIAIGASAFSAGASVEDFQNDANPALPGLASAVFEHAFMPHEYYGIGPVWDLFDFESVSPNHSLFVVGTDSVTFDLPPGETVRTASVWMKGYGGPATFHVIGTNGDVTLYSPPSGPFEYYETNAYQLGDIVEIRLSALEGAFDDLTIYTDTRECPGDINGDGRVDLTDLAILLANFGSTGTGLPGDFDEDGDVDLSDLATLLRYFGTVCTSD